MASKTFRPTKDALGKNPGVSFEITLAGRPATMDVLAGETIDAATHNRLTDDAKALFAEVPSAEEAPADKSTADAKSAKGDK